MSPFKMGAMIAAGVTAVGAAAAVIFHKLRKNSF